LGLVDRIKADEGLKLSAYHDKFGYPTIGYGHKLSNVAWEDLSKYPDITEQQAQDLLDQDIAHSADELYNSLPWTDELSDPRHEVLVEMVFQMGIGGLLEFKNTLAACEKGNYVAAAAGMRASAWHKETPARCERLAMIMQTGIDA
jgi:lysozyme